MSKVQSHQINQENYEKNLVPLFDNLAKFDNPKFIRRYLESLLTESELIMISRRIEIARLLLEDDLSYEEISRKLKVGISTVTSVNNNLKKFLSQYQETKSRKTSTATPAPYGSFKHLRKTYKGYFAIINALTEE